MGRGSTGCTAPVVSAACVTALGARRETTVGQGLGVRAMAVAVTTTCRTVATESPAGTTVATIRREDGGADAARIEPEAPRLGAIRLEEGPTLVATTESPIGATGGPVTGRVSDGRAAISVALFGRLTGVSLATCSAQTAGGSTTGEASLDARRGSSLRGGVASKAARGATALVFAFGQAGPADCGMEDGAPFRSVSAENQSTAPPHGRAINSSEHEVDTNPPRNLGV